MATGTLAPVGRQQYLDANGTPLAGGKLYWTAAGTSTPLDTYSDSTLLVANANPVILDSAGRATVYLSAASYKLVVKNSADVTQYTVDPVPATNIATSLVTDTISGRLTLESSVPISTTDQSAKTTLYFTPYLGNHISLYDGSAWSSTTFAETSLSLAGFTASKPYDIFGYLSSGTFTLEAVVWTNTTTRATSLATQDGVYVKSGSATKRYLGTIYINASGGQTDDTAAKRYVWNYYNRLRRALLKQEATTTWTYTTATLRQANGSTANQVDVMVGVAEATLALQLVAFANNSATTFAAVAIGQDSTTTAMSSSSGGFIAMDVVGNPHAGIVVATILPAVGRHFYAWLEESIASGTTTFYGTTSSSGMPLVSGLSGFIEG
jgi:hypothetical protein